MNEQMKSAFQRFDPRPDQTAAMYQRLMTAAQPRQRRKRPMRLMLALAVALSVFFCGWGINAATDGALVSSIKEVFFVRQEPQDVTSQAAALPNRRIEVWAPELYGIDQERLVFGTQRGLLVYDRRTQMVRATVDVQAVGCIYFNSDPKWTHVLVEGERLVLFNSEQGTPFGSYYVYDLTQTGTLTPVEQGTASNTHYQAWQEQEKRYADTFTRYHDHPDFKTLLDSRDVMYGRRTVTTAEGQSLLTIENGTYFLCTFTDAGLDKTPLNLDGADLPGDEVYLPLFTYSGDDPAIAAICDWFYDDALRDAERGDVWIPAFVLHKQVERDGELLVFGNFWSHAYKQNGNMMECTSGGEMPACFHLKKTETGYTVASVEQARDGADYADSIKAFTRGYPGLYLKFMLDDNNDQAEIDYMRMYVEDNDLDIRYIKHYGWDPVEINE